MLNALETGVKGNRWFSLIDKVYSPKNLEAAYVKVAKNKGAAGIDRISVQKFTEKKSQELDALSRQLGEGTYQPQDIRRVYIPKAGDPKGRPLGIPVVRDRVVQTALRNVCEPIFEREFAERSFGFRPGRGCKDALREVDSYLNKGYRWVVDVDIKSYFDTIPHDKLMGKIEERISDTGILALIRQYLNQRIMDGLSSWKPEEGTPQGAIISPLLSNVYLNPLDHLMERNGYVMIRYADDMIVMCQTETEAKCALETLQTWMLEAQLTLHPTKTKIVNVTDREGFDFLGYHFQVSKKDGLLINHWPRKKSLVKLRGNIRPLTKRLSGQSMECIVGKLNPILRGWFGYFKHSKPERVFEEIDGWVRMRLRSILRHRSKRRGWANAGDKMRWPIAYFTEIGLYSLKEARILAVQSQRANH
jgi:RNA-directed DNA polymerase